ncbi:MAG: DUF58 domain-containing protein [Planctomycetes bacterium]|nr:DUF58 domain-containing protein [Planctomycetota bacterium]
MSEHLTKYLDPRVLSKLSRLELKARRVVEGFISGLHRSPYHGFSVEFAEHREYVPGDDVRHIDWKVFGRSDRFYIKQYEEETNLVTHILLDASESMTYASGGISKYEYGTYVAASLAYLLLRQQDAVGLALFDSEVRDFTPPRSAASQLGTLVSILENPPLREKTDIGRLLHEYASRIKKKGLIVIISDMLDDLEAIERGLKHLRYRQHEVIVFHVLDPDELSFPFRRMTLFEGLEARPDMLVNPGALRDAYLAELNAFLDSLRRMCRSNRFDYVRLATRDKLDVALSTYLAKRAGSVRR